MRRLDAPRRFYGTTAFPDQPTEEASYRIEDTDVNAKPMLSTERDDGREEGLFPFVSKSGLRAVTSSCVLHILARLGVHPLMLAG